MTILRKKIIIGLIISLFLILVSGSSYAGSFSLTPSNSTVTVGSTFTVTISAPGLAGKFTISASSNISINKTSEFIDDSSTVVTCTANSAGTATITVTAADVADYSTNDAFTGSKSVSVTIKDSAPPPSNNPSNPPPASTTSSDAYLSALSLSGVEGLNPNFSKTTYNYTANVDQTVTDVTVNYTPSSSKAKVTYSGGSNLQLGENKIVVNVTAQDGATKKTYTITVVKSNNPALADATLTSLTVDNYPFTFDPNITEYDIGTIDNSLTSLNIAAIPTNASATLEILGADALLSGENTITVKVTSVDGTVVKEYTIKYNKPEQAVDTTNNEDTNSAKSPIIGNVTGFVKAQWLALLATFWFAVALAEFIILIIPVIRKLIKNREDKGKH